MVAIHKAGVEHGGRDGSLYTAKDDKVYITGFSGGKEGGRNTRMQDGWRYMGMIASVGVDTIIKGGVDALVARANGEPDARPRAEELYDLVKANIGIVVATT
ncbi:hypothetical protein TRAPUB_778 [Trametes pubescens]|uniref:Uncharacterized protein n=1 Tax=Trametes pubescens TaxID=154538 RepID=A0A1M2VL95_TRAPU|nr:hypothetical protein TRAPUB_778 [Trametes pubescens]